MDNLFDQPEASYKFDRKVLRLRKKIAARTAELNIRTDHSEDGHFYVYGESKYPSVTGKLQVVKDPGLSNWKMNRACDYIKGKFDEGIILNIEECIKNAKIAPQLEFKEAGSIGNIVHAWRETWFNEWIKAGWLPHPKDFPTDSDQRVIAASEAIKKCVNFFHAQPLACELKLADDKLKLGGTLDDLWAVPVEGKLETWLIDLKTSNIGNKNSYMMQVATYWAMFKKLYKMKIDRVFILHTSKTVFGEYEMIEVKHPKRYFEMAKTAFKLSDELEELTEIKKPIINKI